MFSINIFKIDLGTLIPKKLFRNPMSWSIIALFIMGVVTFALKQYYYSSVSFFIACLILFGNFIHYYKKVSRFKNKLKDIEDKLLKIYSQFTKLHEIIHEARNALHSFSLKDAKTDGLKITEINARIINKALDQIASIFTELLQADCITSVMLPSKEKPDIIETNIRSNITLSQRKDSGQTRLLKGQGMAGMCFSDGEPRWSNDFEESAKRGEFFPIRKNWKDFYLSGISSPFKVDGKIAGVFNLDCTKKNVFIYPEKMKFLVQLGGDTVALAMQISEFLKCQ